MDIAELKARVCAAIDARSDDIIALGEDVRRHPELGFKEHRTSDLVAKRLSELGVPLETGIAITGLKGILTGRQPGPTVAYMGEMDSVLVRDHPDADPVTGAVHACGHNAQVANLIGVAYGLVESGAMRSLDGQVALMGVPAEEYVEIDYRLGLQHAGVIEFLGGKPEMIRAGAFDDVSLALSTHLASRVEGGALSVGKQNNGCVVKQIRYIGKAAHAGGAPHAGVNALKAALLGLQGIDALRDTFRDEDHIRVHPIITKGGELVNVVPDDVLLETYVRGLTVEAIESAASKVDRCLKAGAMALGATVQIRTLPGYLPKLYHQALADVYQANVECLLGAEAWWEGGFGAGSTDIGDLSHLIPVIEAQANGASGTGHGADYAICDPIVAYVTPAKVAAMTVVDLLINGADVARSITQSTKPALDKQAYLALMRSTNRDITWRYEE